jgi:hypothetical protein
MAVEARINKTWRNKWFIMAAMLFGFAGWSIYDATVAYPAHNERVAQFQEHKEAGRISEWPAYAKERGWSDEDPGDAKSDLSIQTQWYQAALTSALGLFAIVMVLRAMSTRLAAEEEVLIGPKGQRVPYEQITEIDKQRWDSKGIAIVHYGSEGQKGSVKIDDWVYRDADLVLAEVERRTGLGTPI